MMEALHDHPEYVENRREWETFRDLQEGKQSVLTSPEYLIEHFAENHPKYGNLLRRMRARRSRYLNLMEMVTGVWTGIFFKEDPQLDQKVKDLFGEHVKSVDGKGNSLTEFVKKSMFLDLILYGKCVVYTFAPKVNGDTKADEAGHRAFFYSISPLALRDWQMREDAEQEFEMIRYEYHEVQRRSDLTQKPVLELRSVVLKKSPGGGITLRIYKQKDAGVTDGKRWELVEERGIPQLEHLPVVGCFDETWVRGVAEMQLQLFNYMSAYSNQLNHSAFQRHVFSGPVGDEDVKTWGDNAALIVPQGTQVTTIEPADMTGHERAIELTIQWLFKVGFNRIQSLAANSKAVAGADTIREMKDELLSLVQGKIEEIENAVNRMVKHYAVYVYGPEKGAKFDGRVTFSRDVSIEDVEQLIEMVTLVRRDIDEIPSWRKAVLKKFAQKMDLPDKDEERILKDIEALPDEPARPEVTVGPNGALMSALEEDGGQGQQDSQSAEPQGERPARAGRGPGGPAGRGA
jgi:hypothetical protein